MIVIDGVTKRFKKATAVADLSFTARPGAVTALLGPNGAGKSTTLRVLLGLDRPDEGRALIDDVPYADMRAPLQRVGALIDAGWMHPRRSVRAHLRWIALSNGIPRSRIDEVLHLVGLESVAGRSAGKLSLGMRQRAGIAAALLGDPDHLVLDEPANGLDPEGVLWIRALMRSFADNGGTVLMSSHMLTEVAQSADDVVVIARGSLRYSGSIEAFTAGERRVRVRAERPAALMDALGSAGMRCENLRDSERGAVFTVADATEDEVARAAARTGAVIYEISQERASIESAFLAEIAGEAEFEGRL